MRAWNLFIKQFKICHLTAEIKKKRGDISRAVNESKHKFKRLKLLLHGVETELKMALNVNL